MVANRFASGATLSQIAREAGLHVATAHRLLMALVHEGFLTFDPYAKTYQIGFDLLEIAESAQGIATDLRLRHSLRPMMTRVAARIKGTIYLSIRSGPDSLCISCIRGSFPISANTLTTGSRRPLGIGAGSMALLADLPAEEADRITKENTGRFDRYSGITSFEVETGIARCRSDGYAFNDGRIVSDVVAIGMVCRVPDFAPVVGLSVAMPKSRLHLSGQQNIVDILNEEICHFLFPSSR
jgi:DNA-binding IclR family transcriptional regulator